MYPPRSQAQNTEYTAVIVVYIDGTAGFYLDGWIITLAPGITERTVGMEGMADAHTASSKRLLI